MDRRQFLARGAVTTAGAVVLTSGGVAQAATPATATPTARPPRQPASMGLAAQDFPKVGGDLGNKNYSTLSQIGAGNVKRLGGAWRTQLEGGSTAQYQECTVVAENGVLYVQTTQQNVFAVNGKTGEIIWKTAVGSPAAVTDMRGVGLGQGLVFSTSGANIAYALDQQTGAVVWQTPLLNEPVHGLSAGTLAGAATYHDGLVYIGMSGSTSGARGHCYALDAATGAIVWTFWSCPATGEYGNDTWAGTSWQSGGAVPWVHPAIDPDLGLLYWAFGNPYPRTDGATREGTNLFANSLVALDLKTGNAPLALPVGSPRPVGLRQRDGPGAGRPQDRRKAAQGRRVRQQGRHVLHPRAGPGGEPVQGMQERPVPQDIRQFTAPTQPYPRGHRSSRQQPGHDNATRPVPFYETGGRLSPRHWDRPIIIFPGASAVATGPTLSFNLDTGLVYVGYGLIDSAFSNGRDGRVNTPPVGEYFAGGIAPVDPLTNRSPGAAASGPVPRQRGASTAGLVYVPGPPRRRAAAWTIPPARALDAASPAPARHQPDQLRDRRRAVRRGPRRRQWVPDRPASRYGDHLWAFKLGGTVPRPPSRPRRPAATRSSGPPPVTGTTAGNTVTIGRVWDATRSAPGPTENSGRPERHVPAGT